jgi:outer membrane protein OmpA-like peptidoglycan-associated protein
MRCVKSSTQILNRSQHKICRGEPAQGLSTNHAKHLKMSTSASVVTTAQQPILLKPTPLRVSTHVIKTSFGAKLNFDSVYEQLPQRLIPIWYPGEGILKMEHKVTFGQSAAWINTKNIVAIRNFISKAAEKIEIEKIVIKGFSQPTKISIPNIDIARANTVKNFLKREGIDYPIVATGAGEAKAKKSEISRIAIVTIEGKPKSLN